MLAGTFFPLVLVIGLGLLIAIAVIVHEIRLLRGLYKISNSKNLESHTAEHPTVKSHSEYELHKQSTPKEHKSANEVEKNRIEILDLESDNEWLSEIASKLDPASPEDAELLDTARTMLRHANYTMQQSSERLERLKYAQGQEQKELSKRFIERKLIELKSTK